MSALLLRLLAAFLVALANDLSVKESLFIAITWIPKAIVEVGMFSSFMMCADRHTESTGEVTFRLFQPKVVGFNPVTYQWIGNGEGKHHIETGLT